MKKILKLIDKSVILGEVEENNNKLFIKSPLSITQMFNPQTGQMDVAVVPMDIVFSDVKKDKNFVEISKDHIIWEKDMSDFPTYEQNYTAHITGIETPNKSILKP